MISVKVSYTVNPEFVEQNKRNIRNFLSDFKNLTSIHFLYNVFLKEDGLTFIHVSMYEDKQVQDQVLQVPSFLNFQKERDEKGITTAAKVEILELVGSSLNVI